MHADLRRGLVAAACSAGDDAYDPGWGLLRVEATYNPIHTRIVSGVAHRYVASLSYALALCEAGRYERAERVLLRCVADQDTDPRSDTYGLWSYYAEEPLGDMRPPDWNQADFNGRALAMVLLRHRQALTPATREAVGTALHHAARSIARRDVSMDYTNIAAKGTFVTLAAGRLLDDPVLGRYAMERLRRFAANVDATGSFVEYNSPTYWTITTQAITAIGQYLADDEVRATAGRLSEVAWRHLAARWHAPSGQLAGPMSRTYGDDTAGNQGLLLFLRTALGDVAPFGSVEPRPDVELVWPAVLEPSVPAGCAAAFTAPPAGILRRELFAHGEAIDDAPEQRGGAAVPEIVGTTWLDPVLALGTINQADTWLQRRNLLAQWAVAGEAPWRRPARSVRLRVLKDGADFASGSFSSVQDGSAALWVVGFASPGGDRHLHLDLLDRGATFLAAALVVAFDFAGAGDAVVRVGEQAATPGAVFGLGSTVSVLTGGVECRIGLVDGDFGGARPWGRIRRDGDRLAVEIVLLAAQHPVELDLASAGQAFVAGTFELATAGGGRSPSPPETRRSADGIELAWRELWLRGRTRVGTRGDHAAGFASSAPGMRPGR
ncbi:hypothetical protein [Jiangella sp. DSM 45060]|uniref:hypothetical protein n=1 Tax=Jiangella sp. DSM 45060 TaxID=1798224 RepID=UPI00087BB4FB|nr:hypothetical protein [Jiangella sp. DSM 45060]SDS47040.1 hypothetical protein SAMN04515669_1172 [Jiangella sp. DSM 45060]